ncbi:MAG: hypothetical protein DIU78_001075 [Pseudomonadota bacterium]
MMAPTRPTGRHVRLVLGLLVCFFGCSTPVEPSSSEQTGRDDLENPPPAPVIRFDLDPPVQGAPRTDIDIWVRVSPERAHTVRFALLSDPAAPPHDGGLDRGEALTDASGRARVRLRTPSFPVALTLRASVGGVSASLPVVVMGSRSATLIVHASYPGRRTVSEWIGSVHLDATCDGFRGTIPRQGDLTDRATIAPHISGIPPGTRLAVTLHSGQFVSGCTTVENLLEGEERIVFVPVNDLPLRLDTTVLDVAIGIDAEDEAWHRTLDALSERAVSALLDDAEDDVEALLEELQAALPEPRATALEASRANGLDQALRNALGSDAAERLRDAVTRWSSVGRGALLSTRAFEGRLRSGPDGNGQAVLSVQRVGGQPATEVGAETGESSWEADRSDTVAFGSTISWTPSRLFAALVTAPAVAETGATTVPEALARTVSCTTVATTIGSLSDCDTECVEAACVEAVAALWDRVRTFSGPERASLAVTATGSATVGEAAQAVALDGSWLGRLVTEDGSFATGGSLRAFAPRP